MTDTEKYWMLRDRYMRWFILGLINQKEPVIVEDALGLLEYLSDKEVDADDLKLLFTDGYTRFNVEN